MIGLRVQSKAFQALAILFCLVASPVSSAPLAATTPLFSDERVFVESAGPLRWEANNLVTASGGVTVLFRGYTLTSDQVIIDTKAGQASFSGHVELQAADKATSVHATGPHGTLILDLVHGTYGTTGAEKAIVSPTSLEPTGLLLPLYITGGAISGGPDKVEGRDALITTCDFDPPHYMIGAGNLTVVPGKRLIARRVSIYRRGRRLITVPELVLPISDRYERQDYLPQVGQSPAEGYYAKFAIPYVLSAASPGLMRLDLMQNRGVGLGFDQSYSAGVFKLYELSNRQTGLQSYTGSLTHNQTLFGDMHFSVLSQFQNNSYYLSSSQSEAFTNQISLAHTSARESTLFNSTLQQSNYGTGQTQSTASSLSQHEALSRTSSVDVKVDYAQTGSNGTGQSTANGNVDYKAHTPDVDIELLANSIRDLSDRSDLPGGFTPLTGVQRLPELKLTTDPALTKALGLWGRIAGSLNQYTLDLGEYEEDVSHTRTDRIDFKADLGKHVDHDKDLTTNYTASYQQDFYGDDAARYILSGQGGSIYTFGHASSLGVNYSYARPFGYTPFYFDRTGYYNNASANLIYAISRIVRLSVGTGFDFTQDQAIDGVPAAPWQTVDGQIVVQPSDLLLDRITTSYDANTGNFYDLSDSLQVGHAGGFHFTGNARYLPSAHELSTATVDLDEPITVDKREQAGYEIRVLAGYNGVTSTYTYKGLELTRLWHDWEVSAIYEDTPEGATPGSTFYLNFQLRAFPGYQPFGVGAFGAGLGSGIGEVY